MCSITIVNLQQLNAQQAIASEGLVQKFMSLKACVPFAGGHMTKGLHMIRHLHAAGWRVVVTDYPKWNMAMGRFSPWLLAL